jgi:hypothetical protein
MDMEDFTLADARQEIKRVCETLTAKNWIKSRKV